ncbi:MAG TPA: deoxyribonuclease IV [Dissulfurispiraceae bacterium]|nr:deoxyribonuclease IV [Dissulfurispiraceae bacterium]
MPKSDSKRSKTSRRLGVHTSIAGGVLLALERAHNLGCNTMQIFSHNPRQWAVSDLEPETAAEFKKAKEKLDIWPVFAHTSYLINLAATDKEILGKSVQLTKRELDLADALGAEYVVIHTGSLSDGSEGEGRKVAAESLRRVAGSGEWKTRLLLENTAGEKGDITSHIENLAEIMDNLKLPLIAGITLDTCHAFAAGYDIKTSDGLSHLAGQIEKYIGIDKVKLIHLNDARKGLGSGVDRHWHIGEGEIGLDGLKRLINHRDFNNIPLVLETPKKSEEDDPRNLKIVRSMLDG